MRKTRRQPKATPEKLESFPRRGVSPQVWIGLLLVLITLAFYSPTGHFQFVNYDDPEQILSNPQVRDGITLSGLRWALTAGYASNWFPLTWVSHMLDCQLFGVDAGWHHLTSVFIHALSALLLFAVMKRMTGCIWRSGFVAFVFALHPLHVESVAWISERKDVLSAFFWFLSLWAYLGYVERPRIGRYLLVLLAFCLGLMSKQMIVTLPFALLLLDVWPLRRIQSRANAGRILLEKVPLLALSAAASIIVFVVQRNSGSVQSLQSIPLAMRAGNAVISYFAYLMQFVWPTRLSVFYPYPAKLSGWEVTCAGLALVGISILVVRAFRSYSYLAIGWFWYLGTLVPVIGLIQVGHQARADRYTYIPFIGISIMLAWGMADAVKTFPRAKAPLIGLAAVVCWIWLGMTWVQIQYWRSSVPLFEHAIAVTDGNYVAQMDLGVALAEGNKDEEALPHLRESVEENPTHVDGRKNLGAVLMKLGRKDEATVQLREAIRLRPSDAVAHSNLGNILLAQGSLEAAIRELELAVRLNPDLGEAHEGLSAAYAKLGRNDEAIAQLSEVIRLQPGDADAHCNLGNLLLGKGQTREAATELNTALQLDPKLASAHLSLGNALLGLGRVDEGIAHLNEALRINPELPGAYESLEHAQSLKARSSR